MPFLKRIDGCLLLRISCDCSRLAVAAAKTKENQMNKTKIRGQTQNDSNAIAMAWSNTHFMGEINLNGNSMCIVE